MAIIRAVSLVERSPSTVMRLKECSTASLSADLSALRSTARSVMMKASMVAMFGCIMPAPLAMALMVAVCLPSFMVRLTCLGYVSVVIMAAAASLTVAVPSARAMAFSFGRIFATGSLTPITPVEQMSTRGSGRPSASPASVVSSVASCWPGWPVQALAFPLVTMTACARPERILAMPSLTWAALTRLVVNVAAALASTSETMRAMSGAAGFLIPALAVAKRNPLGFMLRGSVQGPQERWSP